MYFKGDVNEVFPWKEDEKDRCLMVEISLTLKESDDIYQVSTKEKEECTIFECSKDAIGYIQQLIDNSVTYDAEKLDWMFLDVGSKSRSNPIIRFIGRTLNTSERDITYTIRVCKVKFIRGESNEQ